MKLILCKHMFYAASIINIFHTKSSVLKQKVPQNFSPQQSCPLRRQHLIIEVQLTILLHYLSDRPSNNIISYTLLCGPSSSSPKAFFICSVAFVCPSNKQIFALSFSLGIFRPCWIFSINPNNVLKSKKCKI